MPIIVKDFTWTQTDHYICVHVPLHSAPSSAVDLFTSDEYFKASFESFFFECFPYESINSDESSATILSTKIIYELKKQNPEKWPQLEKILSKDEKKAIKAKAIVDTQEKLTKQAEDKRNNFYQAKRDAVSMSVEIDGQQRRKIDELREKEKIKALGDIEELKIDTKSTKFKKSKVMLAHYKKTYQQSDEDKVTEKDIPAVPMPRSYNGNQGVVEVEFTPRVLPTPSRESKEEEEIEWLSKQVQARRTAGFVSEDLRPEEKNPDYILFKGKKFMEHKNYLGAISAFSFGIELSPNLVDFYILRSQAHYLIGNIHNFLVLIMIS